MLRSVRNFLISFSNSGDILSSCPCLRPDFLVLAAIPSFIPFTVISLSCSARSSSTRINSSQRVSHYGYPFSFCPLSRSDFSPLNLHGCPTENSNMRLSAFYQYFPNLSSEFVCYVCATRMCYASKLTTFLENFQNPKHKKNPGKSRFSEVLIVFCIRLNYRLLNCGARRAALRPYFLRSFIRGSRVRNPAALRTGLYSASASRRALATPCLMAPACPVYPPPCTFTSTSNFPSVSVAASG